MKPLRIILLTAAILALAAGHLLRAGSEKNLDEKKFLSEIAPGKTFSPKKGNPPHYLAGDGSAALNTYDFTPGIRGYAGPIKTLISLSPDGKITGIKILEHRETKNYVHYMESPRYLSRFIGKTVYDKFEVDSDIDGISRATESVEALANSVRESSRAAASGLYGLDVLTEKAAHGETGRAAGGKWLWYLALFLFSFSSYLITRKKRSKALLRLRDLSLAASILIIGLYLSSPFSILNVFNLALLRPSMAVLWHLIVFSVLLSMVFAGRFYCGWLCPYGALSEFISRLFPLRKWAVPPQTDERWRKLKYIVLGLTGVAVFLAGRADYGNIEPFVTLFSFHGSPLAWTLVAVTLAANLRIKRLWCRYLCPAGALGGLLSRKDAGYSGGPDCPVSNGAVSHIGECIRCNRCYNRAGNKAGSL